MTWKPNLASPEVEKLMEDADLPESDRDDARKFVEFLRWRKDRKAGENLPMVEEMKNWLLGKE